jgi:hypothetical protein
MSFPDEIATGKEFHNHPLQSFAVGLFEKPHPRVKKTPFPEKISGSFENQ